MKYVSTRGAAPVVEFGDVLLAGLAADGGLYVPEEWPASPTLPIDADADADADYAAAASAMMAPYVAPSIDEATFSAMVADAYGTFTHPEVCPVRPIDDGLWLLELFWGPTLAFKDLALQLVGRLFDHELTARGERATIVVATSGDTGSAAIEACRGRRSLDIVVLHPEGRVSDVQRHQMTSVDEANVHNVAVEGTFDDCQDAVKAMFADGGFRDAVGLSAMNSINWARVMAQTVYYATAARTVGAGGPVAYAVPTGNFGNVFAGWVARRTGTPISQLVVGSNSNDILTRWLASGVLETRGVHPTISPAMDIQVSSNVERLLFELYERNATLLVDRMTELRAEGTVETGDTHLATVTEVFDGASFDDRATRAEIRRTHDATGVVLDPHTAVGVAAARRARRDPDVPMIALATAHPAKFPDAVEAALGFRPELPDHLADLLERPERYESLPCDLDVLKGHVRAVTGH
jgi:threonine synthase